MTREEIVAELHNAECEHLLSLFAYKHLPLPLQQISEPFCSLAYKMVHRTKSFESVMMLRKLLEAKDCAVRGAL